MAILATQVTSTEQSQSKFVQNGSLSKIYKWLSLTGCHFVQDNVKVRFVALSFSERDLQLYVQPKM